MNLRRDVPLTIVVVLVSVVAVCFGISRAFGQSVGNVGRVGALMAPRSAPGGSGPNLFGIVTEDGAQITTEDDQPIVIEAAP